MKTFLALSLMASTFVFANEQQETTEQEQVAIVKKALVLEEGAEEIAQAEQAETPACKACE